MKNIWWLAVDLDETVAATVNYMLEQIFAMFGNEEWLSVDDNVKKYQYAQNIPHTRIEDIKAWINVMKFDNDFHIRLPLLWNCNEILAQINEIIPIKAYITARPEAVRQWTQTWLDKHWFPQAELIMKPDVLAYSENDQNRKANTLKKLYPEISGIIDDHQWLVSQLAPDYQWTFYLFWHKTVENTPINVIPCTDRNDVLKNIKEEYK